MRLIFRDEIRQPLGDAMRTAAKLECMFRAEGSLELAADMGRLADDIARCFNDCGRTLKRWEDTLCVDLNANPASLAQVRSTSGQITP